MTTSQGIDPTSAPPVQPARSRRTAIMVGIVAAALVVGGGVGYFVAHRQPAGSTACPIPAAGVAVMKSQLSQLPPGATARDLAMRINAAEDCLTRR